MPAGAQSRGRMKAGDLGRDGARRGPAGARGLGLLGAGPGCWRGRAAGCGVAHKGYYTQRFGVGFDTRRLAAGGFDMVPAGRGGGRPGWNCARGGGGGPKKARGAPGAGHFLNNTIARGRAYNFLGYFCGCCGLSRAALAGCRWAAGHPGVLLRGGLAPGTGRPPAGAGRSCAVGRGDLRGLLAAAGRPGGERAGRAAGLSVGVGGFVRGGG